MSDTQNTPPSVPAAVPGPSIEPLNPVRAMPEGYQDDDLLPEALPPVYMPPPPPPAMPPFQAVISPAPIIASTTVRVSAPAVAPIPVPSTVSPSPVPQPAIRSFPVVADQSKSAPEKPMLRIIEPPVSGMQLLEPLDYAIEALSVPSAAPAPLTVVPTPPVAPEAATSSAAAGIESDLNMMEDIPAKRGGFLAQRHIERLAKAGRTDLAQRFAMDELYDENTAGKQSNTTQAILMMVCVLCLVAGGAWFVLGDNLQRGKDAVHLSGPDIATTGLEAPSFVGLGLFTEAIGDFIGGLFAQERYEWHTTVFTGAEQNVAAATIITMKSEDVQNVRFEGVVCQLPPAAEIQEEKDGVTILRAQRTLVCLGDVKVQKLEEPEKNTTECVERSDGSRFENRHTYIIKKSDDDSVIGSIVLHCRFKSPTLILSQ